MYKAYFELYAKNKTNYLMTFENCNIAFENDEGLKNAFGYDEAQENHMLMVHSPPCPILDAHIRIYWEYVQRECGLHSIRMDTVHQSMMYIAEKFRFDPMKDHFNRLKWDGRSRVDYWLPEIMGTARDAYNINVGRMFLLSIAARALEPGCQCDHMLVFEGPQGIGKSTACRILFEPWFSDTMPEIHTKDAKAHLRGLLGVEIAEMHAFASSKVDQALLKSFISTREDKFRQPYDKRDVVFKRRCVFIGTTNETNYLRDVTGGRRFWPVKCDAINIPMLQAERDQLFAEAVHRLRKLEKWHPTTDECADIIREQEQRQESDPWQSTIVLNVLAIPDRRNATIMQVYQYALGLGVNKVPNNAEGQRIGKILRALNCPVRRTKLGMVYDMSGINSPSSGGVG